MIGHESTKALDCQSLLGTLLFHVGNFREAEELHRRVLDAKLKAVGPEHVDTVDSMGELAVVLFHTDNAEAIRLYRQVLAFEEKNLGPSHSDTLCTISNLAISLNCPAGFWRPGKRRRVRSIL